MPIRPAACLSIIRRHATTVTGPTRATGVTITAITVATITTVRATTTVPAIVQAVLAIAPDVPAAVTTITVRVAVRAMVDITVADIVAASLEDSLPLQRGRLRAASLVSYLGHTDRSLSALLGS